MPDLSGAPDLSGMEAEVRRELRNVARELLGTSGAPSWDLLAASGWTGLEAPEASGGAAATFAETAVVLEELGRAAARVPYLGAVVLGAGTLLALDASAGRDDLLRALVSGDAVPVAVLGGGDECPGTAVTAPFRLERAADGGLLVHGAASFAPDATEANRLLLLASTTSSRDTAASSRAAAPSSCAAAASSGAAAASSRGAAASSRAAAPSSLGTTASSLGTTASSLGTTPYSPPDNSKKLVIVEVAPTAAGITVQTQPVLDETRRLGTVRAEGAPVAEASVWRFAGDPASAARRLLDRAAVAVACDSLGVAEAMLDATVTYAKVREQFGRPIGSFQAVQHACADMLVALRVSRELVTAAVTAVAAGDPGAWVAASMAKSHATAAAVDVAGKAMQLHGGIGYTWESGIHAYLKRAMLNRSLFGSPQAHRRRLASRYG